MTARWGPPYQARLNLRSGGPEFEPSPKIDPSRKIWLSPKIDPSRKI